MQQLITILHILISLFIIGLVLIQHGKGSDIGASFGSGSSQTMFGSQGVTPFLVKLTGWLAIIFFITSAVLSFIVSKNDHKPNALIVPVNPVAMPMAPMPATPATNSPKSATTGMIPTEHAGPISTKK